jgi:hypothetical protein
MQILMLDLTDMTTKNAPLIRVDGRRIALEIRAAHVHCELDSPCRKARVRWSKRVVLPIEPGPSGLGY